MSVTEALMQVGSWNLKLDNAPIDVRRQFDWFGNIVITPARVRDPNVDFDDLVASAAYSGIVLKRNMGEGRFGGLGLGGYLQTGRGHSGSIAPSTPTWPADFDEILTAWITGNANSNGLELGTDLGAAATQMQSMEAGTYFPPTKPRIDEAAKFTNNEYVIRPDGTVDYGFSQLLFAYTPTVLLSPSHRGKDVVSALEISQWSVDQDLMDFRNYAYAKSQDETYEVVASYSSSLAPLYCWKLNGQVRYVERISVNSNDTTDVDAAAEAAGSEFGEVNFRIGCSVDEFCLPRLMIPGDWVWVWDPDNDITGGSEVIHFGQSIFPQRIRCMGYTWPIQSGMGVYAVNNQTQAITDVTDFVAWETGTTKIDLGSPPKKLNTNPNVSRYKQ